MLLPGAASSSVTAIGEWGPWINGGAWLTVEGKRVDLLYRDLDRVRAVIEACQAGRIERVYQPGHPHAFISAIYMGEVALCLVLWDPENVLAGLKRRNGRPPPDGVRLRASRRRTTMVLGRICQDHIHAGRPWRRGAE